MFWLKINSYFVKLYAIKRAAQRDSELKDSTAICILKLNSHCVTPAAVIVKKFYMILQMTIFLFFGLYQQENRSEIG